jgi:curved DNA-binding protein CbpA
MDRRDPYRILQVQPDADPDVVRAAYRVLARKLHPDASAPLDGLAERRMTDLNWAYALMRDPVKRERWESDRRRTPPPTPAEAATHGAPRGPLGADGSELRLDFGRYEGWTLGEVVRRDPDYLDWLRRHPSGARYRDPIDVLLRRARPKP